MAEIRNIETLRAEISRLKSEVNSKEQQIRERIESFKESMKPGNLLTSFFNYFIKDKDTKQDNGFATMIIRKALLLLAGKILFKKDEHEPGILNRAFIKIKDLIEKKQKKGKEKKYYRFDDQNDSESN